MSTPRPGEPLRLSAEDLFSPQVDAFLEEQAVLQRAMPEVTAQPLFVRIFYSSCFYLSLAGGLGAFVGWMMLEPFFDDHLIGEEFQWGGLLMGPVVTGFVGLFLGAAEGIICRNPQRAAICAAVGLGVGFAGGFIAWILAGIFFVVMRTIASEFGKKPRQGEMPSGIAFLILMMGRATAWALAAIPAGIGQGIALREWKVVHNGLLGGVLGGLLGGLAFDPISIVFTTANGEAAPSRAIGFTVIGLMVGLFVGIVEQWTKSAWLLMKAGPLAGKQFVIFRNPTVLGSAPKADVYLFKDEAIEPRHALIHDRGGRFEIEDLDTADGTYVNGIPVKRQILKSGDQIVVGKTAFEFTLKESHA
jgi:Inner membrane component of T3SS, cytoplasmic domain